MRKIFLLTAVLLICSASWATMTIYYSVTGSSSDWSGYIEIDSLDTLVMDGTGGITSISANGTTLGATTHAWVVNDVMVWNVDNGQFRLDSSELCSYLYSPAEYAWEDPVSNNITWGELLEENTSWTLETSDVSYLLVIDPFSMISESTGGTITFSTVPEPATMALLGLGGIFLRRRRK